MRRFADAGGRPWDAVVGRESWGAFFAIFVPAGSGELRQTQLSADSWSDAERQLDEMDDGALAALLEASTPKRMD